MYDVTIIVPVYCTTEESLLWLDECLQSAEEQDCKIVAVDDGSTVDVAQVVKRHRCDYIARAHAGVSSARNVGAAYATTGLIIPLDCDDRFAKGAIKKLIAAWDKEIPVYPDVRKFGLEDVSHYALLDFDCEHILTHVGFSSVNVLHSKAQWKSIGGWNEHIDFYEDGEYNARLFAQYCGKRFPEPLVEYRMHDGQRTKTYRKQSADYARKILSMIRSLNMACKTCGGRKKISIITQPTQPVSAKAQVAASSLPGELNGLVLVHYVGGKGRGKHYYRGPKTGNPYKVTYDDMLYADMSDARMEEDVMNPSLFIRVIQAVQPVQPIQPAQTVQPVQVAQSQPVETVAESDGAVRVARKDVEQKVALVDDAAFADLPDISNMSTNEIKGIDALPVEVAKKLLAIEEAGHNRGKVVAFLRGVIDG